MRSALNPGVTIAIRRADFPCLVRVAAMQTWLKSSIPVTDIIGAGACLSAQPEIALSGTAGEDDVREPLDLLSLSALRLTPHAGRTVMFAAGNSDENVVFGPVDGAIEFRQLFEADLELGAPRASAARPARPASIFEPRRANSSGVQANLSPEYSKVSCERNRCVAPM